MAGAGCTLLICTVPGCPLAPSPQSLPKSPCVTSWPLPRPQQVTLNPSTSLEQLPLPSSCPPSFPEPGSHWQEWGTELGGLGGWDTHTHTAQPGQSHGSTRDAAASPAGKHNAGETLLYR